MRAKRRKRAKPRRDSADSPGRFDSIDPGVCFIFYAIDDEPKFQTVIVSCCSTLRILQCRFPTTVFIRLIKPGGSQHRQKSRRLGAILFSSNQPLHVHDYSRPMARLRCAVDLLSFHGASYPRKEDLSTYNSKVECNFAYCSSF